MGGIFLLAALLWVTEAIPLFTTSLLVIGLQVILLANPGGWAGLGFETGRSGPGHRAIFTAAADPILVLFFGGFLLAQAAVKEGVDRAMSALLLRPFGGTSTGHDARDHAGDRAFFHVDEQHRHHRHDDDAGVADTGAVAARRPVS